MSRKILFTTCSTVAEAKRRLNARERYVRGRVTRDGVEVTVEDVRSATSRTRSSVRSSRKGSRKYWRGRR